MILAFNTGAVKVVWAKWFQDCIALWKHLDETSDYLLPAPSKRTLQNAEAAGVGGTPNLGPGTPREIDPNRDTPEPDGTGAPGTPKEVPKFDWATTNDEVDGFLEDSSDEEGFDEEENGVKNDGNEDGRQFGDLDEDGDELADMVMESAFREQEEERLNAYGKA